MSGAALPRQSRQGRGSPLDDWATAKRCLVEYLTRWLAAPEGASIRSVLPTDAMKPLTWRNITDIQSPHLRGLFEDITAMGSEGLAARSARPAEHADAKATFEALLIELEREGQEDPVKRLTEILDR